MAADLYESRFKKKKKKKKKKILVITRRFLVWFGKVQIS